MRVLIVAAIAAGLSVSAVSQDDPYKAGPELIAEVEAKCAQGCVVFSRKEAAELEERLNDILSRRQEEAFRAGIKYQEQACPALI